MKTISPWFRTARLLRSIQRALAKSTSSQDEHRAVPSDKSNEHRLAAGRDAADQR